MRREALPRVLAALVGADPADVDAKGYVVGDEEVACNRCRARHAIPGRVCGACGGSGEWALPDDATQALETLHTHGLWPWPTDGEEATGWVDWAGDGTARPPSAGRVITVACVGVDALTRVREVVRDAWPGAWLTWRVMSPEELRLHHARCSFPFSDTHPLVHVFSDQQVQRERSWPEECPYGMIRTARDANDERGHALLRRAWPALRAVAGAGLHLIVIDPVLPGRRDRVVLGVESLP